ncbi:hypothetical protein pb186bvf_019041 [Paramecium bursaria]
MVLIEKNISYNFSLIQEQEYNLILQIAVVLEYAVSGWLMSKRSRSFNQLQTIFRFAINPPEIIKTLAVFSQELKYIQSPYDYGNFDTNDNDQNDLIGIQYWFKNRGSIQIQAIAIFPREDIVQFNDLNILFSYTLGQIARCNKITPGIEENLYNWNVHTYIIHILLAKFQSILQPLIKYKLLIYPQLIVRLKYNFANASLNLDSDSSRISYTILWGFQCIMFFDQDIYKSFFIFEIYILQISPKILNKNYLCISKFNKILSEQTFLFFIHVITNTVFARNQIQHFQLYLDYIDLKPKEPLQGNEWCNYCNSSLINCVQEKLQKLIQSLISIIQINLRISLAVNQYLHQSIFLVYY